MNENQKEAISTLELTASLSNLRQEIVHDLRQQLSIELASLANSLQEVMSDSHKHLAMRTAADISAVSLAFHETMTELHKHLSTQASADSARFQAYIDNRITIAIADFAHHVDDNISKRIETQSFQLSQQNHQYSTHINNYISSLVRELFEGITEPKIIPDAKENKPYKIRLLPGAAIERRLRVIGSILRPKKVVNHKMIRLGADHDGGYVLLDDLVSVTDAFSFGIGDETSFDLALADYGIRVHQFDHTIASTPVPHALFDFHQASLAVEDGDGAYSLASALTLAQRTPSERWILKIDIDGGEWEVLHSIDILILSNISQIILELHNFSYLGSSDIFDIYEYTLIMLSKHYSVIHVHANNFGPLLLSGLTAFPDILELTLVRKDMYIIEDFAAELPIDCDRPNKSDTREISLGDFRF